jgi:hypothetical protein
MTDLIWKQFGDDIDGVDIGDQCGYSVSCSADGSIIATASISHDNYKGHVRIYKNIGGKLVQMGQDLDGEFDGDNSGWSISLSGNGLVIAIGATNNDNGVANGGHTRVYFFNGSQWLQVGNDIDGSKMSGWLVSLSSDGKVLAIGAPFDNSVKGNVKIYRLNGSEWILEKEFIGLNTGDQKGYSLSLSGNGNVLVVGTPYSSINKGNVNVYCYVNDIWTDMGQELVGDEGYNYFGSSVSVSYNGNIIAIKGKVKDISNTYLRTFSYNSDGDVWEQLGDDIIIENIKTIGGKESVSLSKHGNILTVGTIGSYDLSQNSLDSGFVNVYHLYNGIWSQLGNTILSEGNDDYNGSSVCISSDGSTLVIGAIFNDDNGEDSGHTRVFKYPIKHHSLIHHSLENDYGLEPLKMGNGMNLLKDTHITTHLGNLYDGLDDNEKIIQRRELIKGILGKYSDISGNEKLYLEKNLLSLPLGMSSEIKHMRVIDCSQIDEIDINDLSDSIGLYVMIENIGDKFIIKNYLKGEYLYVERLDENSFKIIKNGVESVGLIGSYIEFGNNIFLLGSLLGGRKNLSNISNRKMKSTVQFDNSNGTAFVCNPNGVNYRIQTPKTGVTGWSTLNGFNGKYQLDGVLSGTGPSTIEYQINTLPKLVETISCECVSNSADQSSSQCLQKRRALRNLQNSQKEAKKRKQLSMTKNRGSIRFNNNFPGLMFYLVKRRGNGSKVFRRLCKVNGVYKCKGDFVVPSGMSLDKYLCMISKPKEVVYYSINSYPDSETVLYNKYIYRNGLWNFDKTVSGGVNEAPPTPFIRSKMSETDKLIERE